MDVDFLYSMREAVKIQQESGEAYAEAQAQAEYLEHMRPVMKANLMRESAERSIGLKEMHALSARAYRDHLDGLKAARYEALHHRARIEAARSQLDALRSLQSFQKAQMELT